MKMMAAASADQKLELHAKRFIKMNILQGAFKIKGVGKGTIAKMEAIVRVTEGQIKILNEKGIFICPTAFAQFPELATCFGMRHNMSV